MKWRLVPERERKNEGTLSEVEEKGWEGLGDMNQKVERYEFATHIRKKVQNEIIDQIEVS